MAEVEWLDRAARVPQAGALGLGCRLVDGVPVDDDAVVAARDVVRDEIAEDVARRDYGVVVSGNAVDEDATTAERTRLRDERGPVQSFDFGHAPTEEAA